MMIKQKSLILALITSIFSLHSGYSEADLAKGKVLYNTCIPCHMPDGKGNELFKAPSIAGQESWYTEAQLKKFKDGIRGSHPKDVEGLMMAPLSRTLMTEDDVKNVSAYVQGLEGKPDHNLEGGDAAKGKALYMPCVACHGDKGQGNKALGAPSLSGLNDWYIVKQLTKFKDGIRGTHPKDVTGMQMRPMAMILADEQAMKDVAAYIKSLSK